MKNSLLPVTRIMLVLCGVALVAVLFVPMWRIDLVAPQYPEGLRMLIYPGKLGGDVNIINGLNHYIGMKTLHTEDFIEFKVLPYIISFFAAAFVLVAILNKRILLYILLGLFVSFGVLAMADFWRWEYNYGHNLDPNAAIIVPGMAYQPPLIGYKQLLNFAAYSIPDTGGWIFVSVGIVILALVIFEMMKQRKRIKMTSASVALILASLFFATACSTKPHPIKIGTDSCHYCKMTIADERFGCEVITQKGKVFKFDDTHCILLFFKESEANTIHSVYVVDYSGSHELLDVKNAVLYKSEQLRSPMGGNVAAFSGEESMDHAMKNFPGTRVYWDNLLKQ